MSIKATPARQTEVSPVPADTSDLATIYRANVAGIAGFFARRGLDPQAVADLLTRIDSQQRGTELLTRLAALPQLERQAVELVDIDGLTPTKAAASLGTSAGALRLRLFRARTELRKDTQMTTFEDTLWEHLASLVG